MDEYQRITSNAISIVKTAGEHGVTLRLMGGLAVVVHCHAFHPQHFRGYHDLICSDDWGLWRSVTYNLSKVASLLKVDGYETVVDKPKSLEKLASIRHVIDTKQKTLRWKLRSQVGERVQWYFVEE